MKVVITVDIERAQRAPHRIDSEGERRIREDLHRAADQLLEHLSVAMAEVWNRIEPNGERPGAARRRARDEAQLQSAMGRELRRCDDVDGAVPAASGVRGRPRVGARQRRAA